MKWLVDTNVVSEIYRRSRVAVDWMTSVAEADVRFSVVTISEIEKGVEMARRRRQPNAPLFEAWLAAFRRDWSDHFLPVDEGIAQVSGRFSAIRTRGVHDCQLAATAKVLGLTVVTRNVADFADLPIRVVNPWATAAP